MTKFENEIKIIFDNSKFEIEEQNINGDIQVAVWCESFDTNWSICFQSSDMNGEGGIQYNNPGANTGIDEFYEILENNPLFSHLLVEDDGFDHQENQYCNIQELISDFMSQFREKYDIDNYF